MEAGVEEESKRCIQTFPIRTGILKRPNSRKGLSRKSPFRSKFPYKNVFCQRVLKVKGL